MLDMELLKKVLAAEVMCNTGGEFCSHCPYEKVQNCNNSRAVDASVLLAELEEQEEQDNEMQICKKTFNYADSGKTITDMINDFIKENDILREDIISITLDSTGSNPVPVLYYWG